MPRHRLLALIAAQVAAIGAVALWGANQGLTPDSGLRNYDVLSLHEHVSGLDAAGRPTLALAPGPPNDRACRDRLTRFQARRGTAKGLPNEYAVLVLTDPALVRSLKLSRSLGGCHPGYALLDGDGFVRYRTYDPDYDRHAQEQRILLGALR